jgi:hypothetical protein
MKNFAILRKIPPDLTWDQIDSSAIQNLTNMNITADISGFEFEPDERQVQWVRTYWEPGSDWATCLYQGRDHKAIEDWHEMCEVPYAGIREIEVREPPAGSDDYPRGFHAALEAPPLLVVECPPEATDPALLEGHRWIRSYRDPQSGAELHLFARRDEVPAPVLPPPARLRRVVEFRPQDYEGEA